MGISYQGSCLCGGVTFSVSGFSDQVANCHCSMCRKFHGAAFATLAEVSGLTWHSGENLLQHFSAPNGTVRTFCQGCGASIGFRGRGVAMQDMELAVALFDEDLPIVVDAHIYTRYKANWCALDRGIPAFSEGREE